MAPAISGHAAVALVGQEEHLIFKSIGVQAIRMIKNNRLAFPPILKIKGSAVFRGDSIQGIPLLSVLVQQSLVGSELKPARLCGICPLARRPKHFSEDKGNWYLVDLGPSPKRTLSLTLFDELLPYFPPRFGVVFQYGEEQSHSGRVRGGLRRFLGSRQDI
jgi:hypothetical protein